MKKHGNDYELLLETLSRMQEEKASASLQLESLLKEIAVLRESHTQEMAALRELHRQELAALRESHTQDMATLRESFAMSVESMRMTIVDLNRKLEEKDSLMSDLARQLANAQAEGRLGRKRRFAPTTEQRDLLNNRRADRRSEEKDDFDGTPPSAPATAPQESGPKGDPRRKSAGRRPPKEDYSCDEVVMHPLESYFELPEGCHFKTRNGEVETHEYVRYEHIPGRIIKHVYQTASYVDADGVGHNTLPVSMRHTPVRGCPFSPELLAFILSEKYAYHTPKNRIKIKLREMGASFSKSTFIRHCQLAERLLRENYGEALRTAVMDSRYLMIDETCELVGVTDGDNGTVRYLKRYLWAFYNKGASLVSYLYEQGSRARDVVLKALQGFSGSFSSDGYSAYVAFDGEGHPDITHCGCWSHARRYVIDALGVASEKCRLFLDEIETLFHYEREFRDMSPAERKARRQRLSNPVLNRIFAMARTAALDTVEMGKDLFRKAVNYIRNQEQTLRNFVLDGNAEISNNLVEQRMKPIKLSMKNCQNIGSEDAAINAAFMHSIVESCRLNSKNPYQYLLALFRSVGKALDGPAKRKLMPDIWVPEC